MFAFFIYFIIPVIYLSLYVTNILQEQEMFREQHLRYECLDG